MIEIKDKKDCCGCHACASICAKHSITMQADEEGFLYPVVDKDTCTDCGLCEKVCPVINQSEPCKPLKVYAAKNKNEEIRRQSSSGGIFTLLAEKVIAEDGIVFGARFDEEWNVIHSWTDTIEGIAAFRGSKYVQSTIGDTYRETKDFLKQGRKVLFSGTPCQIAGLKKYLRKEYDNLLTVDVVCHGVPSPLVWHTYLKETHEQLRAKRGVGKNTVPLYMGELPVITGISFRDKTNGWKKFGFRLRYAASEAAKNSVSASAIDKELSMYEDVGSNPYLSGFVRDLYLRMSCHHCTVRSGRSHSDITLADYWGIKNFYPEFADDKGISLVLLNTHKALRVYEVIQDEINHISSTYEEGLRGNPAMIKSATLTPQHDEFWKVYRRKGVPAISIVLKRIKYNFPLRIYRKVKSIIKKKL